MSNLGNAKANKSFLDNLSLGVFGRTKEEAHNNQTCIDCGGDASEFTDERSRAEYHITGMCQKCQDNLFNSFSEED